MDPLFESLKHLFIIDYTLAFIVMVYLQWDFYRPSSKDRRIREEPVRTLKGWKVTGQMLWGSLFSFTAMIVPAFVFRNYFFTLESTAWYWYILEPLIILTIYDFLYYFTHRIILHKWDKLLWIHAMHHRARFPTAIDSLFVHPIENILGLTGLWISITLFTLFHGPIHMASFWIIIFIYTMINILVHCGLRFPQPFAFLGYMAQKHDKHHVSLKAGNFSNVTPLPDIVFGTYEG